MNCKTARSGRDGANLAAVSFYPQKIQKRTAFPRHAGTIADADAAGAEASFVCGSFVSIMLAVNPENSEIAEARYQTNGCGYAVAACELIASFVVSRHPREIHSGGPADLIDHLNAELGAFPSGREHCAILAVKALQKALAGYRERLIGEYPGERALVCTCFGVDEETIESSIIANRLVCVDDVAARCRAGGGCGSCRPVIQDIIDNAIFE